MPAPAPAFAPSSTRTAHGIGPRVSRSPGGSSFHSSTAHHLTGWGPATASDPPVGFLSGRGSFFWQSARSSQVLLPEQGLHIRLIIGAHLRLRL